MTRTALILGANGRFGTNMEEALGRHRWDIRRFDRMTDTLPESADGADLIVNAWNPPYSQWAATVPGLARSVIAAAKATGAAVLLPGNIYVFGHDLPPLLTEATPHRASNPLGRIRQDMEAAYRDAGVKTIILRADDYLDTRASGNWFDMVIAAKLKKGRISYPGPLDQVKSWAFLPDLAEAAAMLADRLEDLPDFTDLLFDGYALTGAELADGISKAIGRPVTAKRMNWLPIHLARPFWPEAKHLLEMRYLWARPHRLDGTALTEILPQQTRTSLKDALRAATAPLLQ